jgi:hypothetical protein
MLIAQAAGEYGGGSGLIETMQSWLAGLGELFSRFGTREYVIVGVVVVGAFILLGRRR